MGNQGQPLAIYTSSGLGRTADKQWMTADANPSSPFRDNVYVGWTLFSGFSSEIWFSRSTDHGEHFSTPVMLSVANNDGPFNTYIFLGTGPDGALYISYSSFPSNLSPESDVWVLKSTDGGQTFSPPIFVNDAATVGDSTDQFQPTVAAGPDGTLAVAFYDRRLACPVGDPNILSADQGQTNFCINTSVQFFSDGPGGLQKLGSNIRVTQKTWDPQNPGSNSDGLPHPGGPNSSVTFNGAYFGLALSKQDAFVLFVSTANLGANPTNDQQQFVGIVPIPPH